MAPRPIGSYAWGYGSSDPSLTLASSNLTAYDILGIPNIRVSTYNGLVVSGLDEDIRDTSDAGDAYGFRKYPSTDPRSRIGFTVTDDEYGMYPEGSVIPVGLAETLKIIGHRNRILSDINISLPIPARTDTVSETNDLTICMALAKEKATSLDRLYFPAASYCYAYEPPVLPKEVRADRFLAHKWFLPAPGDALRLSWLAKQSSADNPVFDLFSRAIELNLCSSAPNNILSTGEYSLFNLAMTVIGARNGFYVGANGQWDTSGRACLYPVWPMVQF